MDDNRITALHAEHAHAVAGSVHGLFEMQDVDLHRAAVVVARRRTGLLDAAPVRQVQPGRPGTVILHGHFQKYSGILRNVHVPGHEELIEGTARIHRCGLEPTLRSEHQSLPLKVEGAIAQVGAVCTGQWNSDNEAVQGFAE